MTRIVDQVGAAVRWTLDQALANKSPSVTLGGHSAGAQLCMMVLASDWVANLQQEHQRLFKVNIQRMPRKVVVEGICF